MAEAMERMLPGGRTVDRPALRAARSSTGSRSTSPSAGELTLDYVLPVVMASAFLVVGFLLGQRLGLLWNWSTEFGNEGTFVVSSCEEVTGFGADQWSCDGLVLVDGAPRELPATLITTNGAFVSDRPYVGEQFDVFHQRDELTVVYPSGDRLAELARLYFSLLPLLLFIGGSAIWLVGWALTRGIDADDRVAVDSLRYPQRFLLRARAMRWLVAGVGATVAYYLITTEVVGSLRIS